MITTKQTNKNSSLLARKQYKKPVIERVNLLPQETVLGGCKFQSSYIPGPPDSDNCKLGAVNCNDPGS